MNWEREGELERRRGELGEERDEVNGRVNEENWERRYGEMGWGIG